MYTALSSSTLSLLMSDMVSPSTSPNRVLILSKRDSVMLQISCKYRSLSNWSADLIATWSGSQVTTLRIDLIDQLTCPLKVVLIWETSWPGDHVVNARKFNLRSAHLLVWLADLLVTCQMWLTFSQYRRSTAIRYPCALLEVLLTNQLNFV